MRYRDNGRDALQGSRADDVVRERKVRDAYADFIRSKAPWSWFVTLTFKREIPEAHAGQLVRAWLRAIAHDVENAHFWFAVGSETKPHQAPHFHLLVATRHDGPFTPIVARAHWLRIDAAAGFARFDPYDPKRGAAAYLSAHECRDLNVACPRTEPRCRRRHCSEARTAW